MKKNKIIILQGPMAAGKSTWAHEFIKDKKDWVIISRDAIREGRGIYWLPQQEGYIEECEIKQAETAVKHGLNIINDATNKNPKTIEMWNKFAADNNLEIEFKEFYIPFEVALQRNKERALRGEKSLSKHDLEKFYLRYYRENMNEEGVYSDKRIKEYKPYDKEKLPCVICDLDGTIALHNNRSQFDFKKIPTDVVDVYLKDILERLSDSGVHIIFITGREQINNAYELTDNWIKDNLNLTPIEKISGVKNRYDLFLRDKNDYRPDNEVKKEIYEKYVKPYYNVLTVFEDRNKVVDMWRELGLLCCQVYYGDF